MNHYTVLLALMVLNIVASAETFAAIPAAALACDDVKLNGRVRLDHAVAAVPALHA